MIDLPPDPRIAAGFAFLVDFLRNPAENVEIPADPNTQKAVVFVIDLLKNLDGTDENIVRRIVSYQKKTIWPRRILRALSG